MSGWGGRRDEVLPEEGVVYMATGAEVEVILEVELCDDVGFVGGSCLGSERCV